jgi:hypothetical protein
MRSVRRRTISCYATLNYQEGFTSQIGCRHKKTIVEEGLCCVERGNSSKAHECIEEFIILSQYFHIIYNDMVYKLC